MPFPVPGRIAEFLRRATVQVRGASRSGEGMGSGIVLNKDRIITNAHVIQGGQLTVETWDGKTRSAKIAKIDSPSDLALLQVDSLDAPAVTLAAAEPSPGEAVIAVGNPLGFIGAVSTGHVFRVGALRGMGWRRWIQADVRLAPGNSGGPLAGINGHVLGLNSMIASGMGLSIPAAALQSFLSSPSTRQRKLGATLRPVMLRSPSNPIRPALLVLELESSGPATRASLLPGDILVSAGGRPLNTPDDLLAALANAEAVELGFHRAGDARFRKVTVKLDSIPVASAA